jgi:TonB-dependent starch-binding outer membrane protein SusC
MKHTTALRAQVLLHCRKLWPAAAAILLMVCVPFLSPCVYAQSSVAVRGYISNQNNEPLSGVTIGIKGMNRTTLSLSDGSFAIDAPANATLQISYVGFISREVKVGNVNQSALSLQLLPDKNELNQVVVVGYGTRKKSDVTGSIVSISEQSIKDIPAANLTQALQGQAAGIDIQKSNGNSKPGATPSIMIRGARSLTASNAPLIVVDGIPFNGNINDLNQDDVSSVEVLKDASATAIYGSRGANGVILVSTKRGRPGKPVVTYNGYAGFVKPVNDYPLMNTQEFSEFKKWALYLGRFVTVGGVQVYKYSGPNDSALIAENFSPEEIQSMKTGRSTDWQKLMYKTGIITNHQLSVTGGTDITQYALSGGYFKETGIYPTQAFERYSLKISVDQQLGKIFKVGLSTLNTFTTTEGEGMNPMGQAVRASPLVSPFDSTGALLNDFVPGSASQVWNPLADFIKGAVTERRKRFGTFTTLFVDVNILPGLKYRFNAGVDIRSDVYGYFFASKTSKRLGQPSDASNRMNFRTNYTLENIVTYDKTFAQRHKVNVTGLLSFQDQATQSNDFRYGSISADYLQYYNPIYASNLQAGDPDNIYYEKWDILSYMGRVNYGFDDKYLLTLTVRVDGSSRLAPGNKYKTFPSASVAWNIHREAFMQGIDKISQLKLRASYGRVGNTAISPYQTLGRLSPVNYNYGTSLVTGVFPSNAPNSILTWEYTATANIGLDFGLFRNRISGSIELYKQKTSDLLLPQQLPPTSGIPERVVTNVGSTENKGLEIQVSTINIQGKGRNNFSWTTDLNFYLNRGKITGLANGVLADIGNRWFVGQPLGVFYDYKKLGIWQNTPEDSALVKKLFGAGALVGSSSRIGTIRVADLGGPNGKPDSVINDAYDRMILGSSQPKWEGGITNRFSYGGFDLTVILFARWGHTISSSLHGGGFVNTFQGTYNNIKTRYWTPLNREPDYPKPNANATNTSNGSLLGFFNGSYVKVRTISLGYSLPPAMLKRFGGRSIRIYATAEDPFILFSPFVKKYGGLDPEAGGGASNPANASLAFDTPSNWSMIFGVNITL